MIDALKCAAFRKLKEQHGHGAKRRTDVHRSKKKYYRKSEKNFLRKNSGDFLFYRTQYIIFVP